MHTHKLFLTAIIATLNNFNVHAMEEQPSTNLGFFVHNATQEHVHFYNDTNQKNPSIITIAPGHIRLMPSHATFLKRIGTGWTPLMEFKTLNPEQYLYCEWRGALPVTLRAPTRQEVLLTQLLKQHETRNIVSQLVLAIDRTKTISALIETQSKEHYE